MPFTLDSSDWVKMIMTMIYSVYYVVSLLRPCMRLAILRSIQATSQAYLSGSCAENGRPIGFGHPALLHVAVHAEISNIRIGVRIR